MASDRTLFTRLAPFAGALLSILAGLTLSKWAGLLDENTL